MSSPAKARIAIVGGGFAGILAAIKIIDRTTAPLDLTIIEERAELGRGIAYSAPDLDHIVNGPAKIFSLHADRPEHLTQWLAANPRRRAWTTPDGTALAESFPPRLLYGDYVQDEFARALKEAGARVTLRHVRDRAVALEPAGGAQRIRLASGAELAADQVVLATGLFTADRSIAVDAALRTDGRYVADVWADDAFAGVGSDGEVLLLGSSLTSLDALISLEKRGFRGTYVAVSRRGQLVQERRDVTPWPDFLDPANLPESLPALLRQIQLQRRAIAAAGEDWQRLTPAIRPLLPALWAKASDKERAAFARRLRVFWDISLHRAAPPTYRWLDKVRSQGRFRQLKGHVLALHAQPDGVRVAFRSHGADAPQELRADLVVNGLGHEFDWRRIADPLVRDLITRDLVRPHPTGYGIAADPATGAVLDKAGRPTPGLYAVGHPLRGAAWESSAIPEQVAGATALGEAFARLFEAKRDVA